MLSGVSIALSLPHKQDGFETCVGLWTDESKVEQCRIQSHKTHGRNARKLEQSPVGWFIKKYSKIVNLGKRS